MQVRIRRLTAADADATRRLVATCHQAAISEIYARRLFEDDRNVLVIAEIEREIVGFVLAHWLDRLRLERRQLFVYEIGVGKAHRRQGIGSRLMQAVLDEAGRAGADTFLVTNRSNQAAMALYQSLGGRSEADDEIVFEYPAAGLGTPDAPAPAGRRSVDRELIPDVVRACLHAQFPHLALASVEPLGSGWDYDAYLIDGSLVVRFPRRREVAAGLDREEAILRLVNGHLGGEPLVPEICLRGRADEHFPHAFFGHRAVPGRPADEATPAALPSLALALGAALSRLHALPAEQASANRIGPESEGCRELLAELLAMRPGADEAVALAPGAWAWLDGGPQPPDEDRREPVFLHNDLAPEHVLIDPASGALNGIIDWSDVALGDPALDFFQLLLWGGEAFMRQVMDAYTLPLDEGFLGRARFLARVRALKWLADGVRESDDVQRRLGWVGNAFAEASMSAPVAPERRP